MPCHGQTLGNELNALRIFVQDVASRHDGQAPVLYGNCQAEWEVMLLAAHCHVSGFSVLNGSPLSYWSGESGVNPMRLLGGFSGGVWFANLLGLDGQGAGLIVSSLFARASRATRRSAFRHAQLISG